MSGNGTIKPLPTPAQPRAKERQVTQAELNFYSAFLGHEPTIDPAAPAALPVPPKSGEPTPATSLAHQLARRLKRPSLQIGLATATRRLLEAWARVTAERPAPQALPRTSRSR